MEQNEEWADHDEADGTVGEYRDLETGEYHYIFATDEKPAMLMTMLEYDLETGEYHRIFAISPKDLTNW